MARISPLQQQILETKNEEFGWDLSSSKKEVDLKNLDLTEVLNYFKKRYEELALCIPSLLNTAASPLRDATESCLRLHIT